MKPEDLAAARRLEPAGEELRIGVSACLLGQELRYDGGHKRDHFVADVLAPHVRYVPVCPEVEIGLGIPREAIRLERRADGIHLVAPKSGLDHTAAMRRFAARTAREIERLDLCGFLFKKNSPSCGLFRVRVHGAKGAPSRDGRGLFAEEIAGSLPLLPLEEEGRLNDPRLRENFVERAFAYRRLRSAFPPRWRPADLVRFHTAEKLLLLAHDPATYRRLGPLVARAGSSPREEVAAGYRAGFMAAMSRLATPGRHANTLQHAAGHLKKLLPEGDRTELAEAIEEFRRGLVPLVVPVTLLRHHVRRHGVAYLQGQTYLEPSPRELMLRNHV